MDDYLSKPIDPARLILTIQKHLANTRKQPKQEPTVPIQQQLPRRSHCIKPTIHSMSMTCSIAVWATQRFLDGCLKNSANNPSMTNEYRPSRRGRPSSKNCFCGPRFKGVAANLSAELITKSGRTTRRDGTRGRIWNTPLSVWMNCVRNWIAAWAPFQTVWTTLPAQTESWSWRGRSEP